MTLADFHGQLGPHIYTTKDKQEIKVGGAPLVSSYLSILKSKTEEPVVIIDSGDLFQGTLVSNLNEGRPVVKFYNHIGVAAAALGNHDFDYGPVDSPHGLETKNNDIQGALKQRMGEAEFKILAANVFLKSGGRPEWLSPSRVVEGGNVKVGIIGASSVDTPNTTFLRYVDNLVFEDPVSHVVQEAAKLRDEGADFIVLTIHTGGLCEDNHPSRLNDLSSCKVTEIFDIVKRFPSGSIDLVVAGHTHRNVAKVVNGIPIVQPPAKGRAFYYVDLEEGTKPWINPVVYICDRELVRQRGYFCDPDAIGNYQGRTVLARFLGDVVKPDQVVEDLFRADFVKAEALKKRPLGVLSRSEFERKYGAENGLGNMISEVFARANPDIDAVAFNNGGFRANLSEGPVTFGEVYNIMPFDNTAVVMSLSGRELISFIELGLTDQNGGISWGGLTFTYTKEGKQGRVREAFVRNKKLDPHSMYKVVTADYVAEGGMGFTQLKIPPTRITPFKDGLTLRELIIEALQAFDKPLVLKDFFDASQPRQTKL